jgi:hypothetical protein
VSTETLMGFLNAIDAELVKHATADETLELHLIGRSAMILGFGLQLMTKDVDVVEVRPSHLLTVASEVFKKGAPGNAGYGFYLETVSSGFPPLPIGFEKRCIDIVGPWQVIRPKRPEGHDLVVTKLKRFHQGDREDVRILCDTGEIEVQLLRSRFEMAHVFSDLDDPKVVKALMNLESVVEYLNGRRSTL